MIPIVSVDLMRASDAYTIKNFISDIDLMEKAGKGISLVCIQPWPLCCCLRTRKQRRWRLCLRPLFGYAQGKRHCVLHQGNPSSESAKHHRALLDKYPEVTIKPFSYTKEEDLTQFNVIVDCLLGTGFSGTPQGLSHAPLAQLMMRKQRLNRYFRRHQ